MTVSTLDTPVGEQAGQHTLVQSALLHLLPGIAGLLATLAAYPLVTALGLPALLAQVFSGVPAVLLASLGLLLLAAKRESGTFAINRVIGYREPISAWQYAVLPLVLVLWSGLVVGILQPFDRWVQGALFGWFPGWLAAGAVLPQNLRLPVFIYWVLVGSFLAVYVQELYMRGYLLPRMQRWESAAPLLHAFLFSASHLTMPWQWLSGTVVFLPVAYLVRRTRNLYLSMIYHMLMNLLSGLALLGIAQLPGG